MASSLKSKIPQRVKHSLTALHGPNSRICRSRSAGRSANRCCSLYRSRLPLPVSSALSSLVKSAPEVVGQRPETEAVIRSLVKRSIPPPVRGNRTSFRRIQMAHSSPVAMTSLVMRSQRNLNQQKYQIYPQAKSIEEQFYTVEDRDLDLDDSSEEELVSPRSLLKLVSGKRQPEMHLLRFLCSDHRLINVPSRLMYRHSATMRRRQNVEQPIELRAIRSTTLLRVIMWMHQKNGTGNANFGGQEDKQEMGFCSSEINGIIESKKSCEIGQESTKIPRLYGHKESLNTKLNAIRPIRDVVNGESFASGSGSESQKSELSAESGGNKETHRAITPTNPIETNKSVKIGNGSGSDIKDNTNTINFDPKTSNTRISVSRKAFNEVRNDTEKNSRNQDQFVCSAKSTETSKRENSGDGIEVGRNKENREKVILTRGKPNSSVANGIENKGEGKCGNHTESAGKADGKPLGNGCQCNGYVKCKSSWEERLLGSELCQLVELILAAHFLGVDSLCSYASHYFGELMAQRTRKEVCILLRIRACLAEVRQVLDGPLIREILAKGTASVRQHCLQVPPYPVHPKHFLATGSREPPPDPNWTPVENRTSRLRRNRAIKKASESTSPLCAPKHRHHQHCFHSRF
ncbi:LOW QUALITY PROTEIN: uncharacterized protein LOC108095523 [Drosophila ficusphila]|uniref:LOW QUALITY PROTEIN: uncharacterized protein LOC108095523 n=1 Tax=Drosophila ficusphila TaxID=30025 RepID=UPI001C8A0531|nr:LOW QUALITY PROTEIN: uncharacterized protein LOC108095523 [Drosophila ficusphila]